MANTPSLNATNRMVSRCPDGASAVPGLASRPDCGIKSTLA